LDDRQLILTLASQLCRNRLESSAPGSHHSKFVTVDDAVQAFSEFQSIKMSGPTTNLEDYLKFGGYFSTELKAAALKGPFDASAGITTKGTGVGLGSKQPPTPQVTEVLLLPNANEDASCPICVYGIDNVISKEFRQEILAGANSPKTFFVRGATKDTKRSFVRQVSRTYDPAVFAVGGKPGILYTAFTPAQGYEIKIMALMEHVMSHGMPPSQERTCTGTNSS
jgi:hypothetical protein